MKRIQMELEGNIKVKSRRGKAISSSENDVIWTNYLLINKTMTRPLNCVLCQLDFVFDDMLTEILFKDYDTFLTNCK